MTEEQQHELLRENAALLKEKAEAQAEWHKEIRDTLRIHGTAIARIEQNTNGYAELRVKVEKLETTMWEEVTKLREKYEHLNNFKFWLAGGGGTLILAFELYRTIKGG